MAAERSNEPLFRDLLDAAPDPIVIVNEAGAIVHVNSRVAEVFGYDPGDLLGERVEILIPERFAVAHRVHRGDYIAAPSARPMGSGLELWALRHDGTEVPVEISLAPLETPNGTLVSAALRDVSAQRQARQRLADSARHFELIQDLVATCGYDGYFKVINGAWEQVLGWSDEQLLPNPFIEIVHPDDRDAVEREVARVAAGAVTADFIFRIATTDGRWLWTEWSAVPDPDPDRGLFHCSGREISSRMETERALASERRQFADAQQIAKVGSWELDPATGERRWSEQQFRNHGFDPSRPPPEPAELIEAIHPEDRDAVRALLEEIERKPRSFEHSYRVVLANGSIREIAVEGRPFVAADESVRMIGTSRDVTAERAAERLKDEFFQLVSHELRTPLTSIVGYAELLAEIEADNLSPEGRRFVEVIDRNSKRELNLVGDLLMLTRITAGTFQIEVGQADLGEIARATAEAMDPDAARAGVEISLDVDRAPVIAGDPHRLRQVVENLVSNAIKFTPRGGSVTISAARDGELAEIAVADTGIGIPPEDRGRLFERMFRAREAERRHIQGTGLGLTIVKAIVDAHAGTITVDSDVGEGATFRVKLPVAEGVRTDRRARPRGRSDRRRAPRRRVGGE